MNRPSLVPCPRCRKSLVEAGFVYPGGQVVARDAASRPGNGPQGSPIGVQFACTHCGTSHAFALKPRPIAS